MLQETVAMKNTHFLVGAVIALGAAACVQGTPPAAQQEPVVTTYRPIGKRVSPQDGFAASQHSTVRTPRDAKGHPDLSGTWTTDFPSPLGSTGLRADGTFEPDQAVLQRGAQWNKPLYKPEYWEKVRTLDFGKVDVDPAYGCGVPVGVPRQNVPGRIIQKDNEIMLLNSVQNGIRILPLDPRQRDSQDFEYSLFNGQGLARWDDDTLVVESIGFNDITWLGWEGYFHTDKMKVTERFRREGDLLFYNFRVEDPDVLLEPWTSITYVRKLNPEVTRVDEPYPCEERDLNQLVDPYERG
jgi:hypothetical protein